jgi:tRNA modification GTPase
MIHEFDTIAAISTAAMGNGGIGIVRMSGLDAVKIADRIFHGKKKLSECESHTIHYGKIIADGRIIDEVLVMLMRAPKSYTMEDVVEINCHGGMYVTNKVLEACISAGASPAQPGEFTKRAFLNGRIDLSQAEAVIDVINAKNEYALQSSVGQLDGSLSEKIKQMRAEIIHNIAYIEAALDDPEHISLDNFGDKLLISVDNTVDNVDNLLKTYDNGRLLSQGIETVILGKPNAGKSSLLNVLSKAEIAIVTEVAGTTRDMITGQINLDGIILKLVDTAGIRDTVDIVEKIGVDRAIEAAKKADLIIYVVDSSSTLDEDDKKILNLVNGKNVIVLLNKSDLQSGIKEGDIRSAIDAPVIQTSMKNQQGIMVLQETIKKMFFDGKISFNDEVYISNIRQKNSLQQALNSLKLVKNSILEGMPEDFYTIDLMNAYEELGKITGESVEDDLVNEIFSKFCMGK